MSELLMRVQNQLLAMASSQPPKRRIKSLAEKRSEFLNHSPLPEPNQESTIKRFGFVRYEKYKRLKIHNGNFDS